jgi:hypothetical protein
MWHRIAMALGGRTIAEWKAAMSQEEFLDWVNFYSREPFGVAVDDKRHLEVCHLLNAIALGVGIKKPVKDFKDYVVSTTHKDIEETKRKLYTNPHEYFREGKDHKTLHEEGKMVQDILFNKFSKK